jgi:hypothetical protein
LAGELELALKESLLEEAEELAPKDQTERLDVEQEVRASGNPAAAILRQGPAGNEAVEMEMVTERLIPGVEHGDETQLSAQVRAAKLQQGLGNGLE